MTTVDAEIAARRRALAAPAVRVPVLVGQQALLACSASRAEARKRARLAAAAASSPRRQPRAYHLAGAPPMAAKQARLVS
jgi:hypothetical protein